MKENALVQLGDISAQAGSGPKLPGPFLPEVDALVEESGGQLDLEGIPFWNDVAGVDLDRHSKIPTGGAGLPRPHHGACDFATRKLEAETTGVKGVGQSHRDVQAAPPDPVDGGLDVPPDRLHLVRDFGVRLSPEWGVLPELRKLVGRDLGFEGFPAIDPNHVFATDLISALAGDRNLDDPGPRVAPGAPGGVQTDQGVPAPQRGPRERPWGRILKRGA